MAASSPASPGAHVFAETARDEIWEIRGRGPRCVERRLDEGFAISSEHAPFTIEGSSDLAQLVRSRPSCPRDLPSRLRRATTIRSQDLIERVRRRTPPGGTTIRIRMVARWIARDGPGRESLQTIIGVDGSPPPERSIVSAPPCLDEDLSVFETTTGVIGTAEVDPRSLPVLWTRGTGAVLLHEAVGHASAHGAAAFEYPHWLEVIDDPMAPGIGRVPVDDAGFVPSVALLTRGERPSAWRRESWRDVPARRMSNLVVRATHAGSVRPRRRIEIHFVRGGTWDPLSDLVAIEVSAADFVSGSRRAPLAPFTIREPRSRIIACLESARGPLRRFPGVLCHDEGQRIPVGSFAPDLLTKPFAR